MEILNTLTKSNLYYFITNLLAEVIVFGHIFVITL